MPDDWLKKKFETWMKPRLTSLGFECVDLDVRVPDRSLARADYELKQSGETMLIIELYGCNKNFHRM